MRRVTLAVLLLFILQFETPRLFSEETVILDDRSKSYNLINKIYLLEDSDGSLDIESVIARTAEFVLIPDAEPNLGFTRSVYWAMIVIQNESALDKWLLELAYPPFDYIDPYIVTESRSGRTIVKQEPTGDSITYTSKANPDRNHIIIIPVKPGQKAEVFLRLKTESSFVFPLKIWVEDEFYKSSSTSMILFGLLFGFFLIMALYHIPLYISSGEKTYLYYTIFVTVYLFFQVSMSGIAALYLWPDNTWWINRSLPVLGMMSIFFTIVFTKEFLQAKTLLPGINRIYHGLLIFTGINFAGAFFIPYFYAIQITNYLMSAVGVLYIISAAILTKRGFSPARNYLIAWIFFILAVIITALKLSGVIPSTPFTSNVLYIGASLEVVLLSIAMGEKIKLLLNEREIAEKEKLQMQADMLNAAEEQLYTDSLTGLASRSKLIHDLVNFSSAALFIINIDHFKGINNFYGNKIGDGLIKLLGRRLSGFNTAGTSYLYRLHADEFALVNISDLDIPAVTGLAGEIYNLCHKETYSIDSLSIPIEVSIGVASDSDNILEKADIALSHSKLTQTNYCIYSPSMQTMKQYENNLKWIEIINLAIDQDRIFPVFQPIFSNLTGDIDKYEALIRLRREDGKIENPGSFLGIAKEAKLYPELSRILIGKSLKILQSHDKVFSINLSLDDLQNEETMRFLDDCISRYDVGNKLVFEILESEGMGNYEEVGRFIRKMGSYGVKFAIDDFGSGYSNFEHLLQLQIDFLKIDASLIKDIHNNLHARNVVETIIAFSRKLNYKTVAEYVHNAEVYNVVKELNIDFSQGYYLSEPVAIQ